LGVPADRAFLQRHSYGLINSFSPFSRNTGMVKRSTLFLGRVREGVPFKFLKRSLLSLSKVFFKRLVLSFKLMESPFKIDNFSLGKAKNILPPAEPLPEVISFSKDFSRRSSAKIRTGFRKGAILTMKPCGRLICVND